jgi:hypothetical protein
MSVKLSGYVFRRIHGRIIPIRKGIELASEAVNKLAREVLSTPVSKKTLEPAKKFLVGRGSDFNVFGKNYDIVMKLPRNKVGTSNKNFLKAFPETKDKVALTKAIQENLPNWNIPTVHTDVVRLKGKTTALIQEKVIPAEPNLTFGSRKLDPHEIMQREISLLSSKTGIDFDAHVNNLTKNGDLIDTGLNLRKSKIGQVKRSQNAIDILGVKGSNAFSTRISEVRPETITHSAAEYGKSNKALKMLNNELKKGKVLARVADNQYKLAYRKPKSAGFVIPDRVKRGVRTEEKPSIAGFANFVKALITGK